MSTSNSPASVLGSVAGSTDGVTPAAASGGIVGAAPQAAASASPSQSAQQPTQPAPASGGSRLARIVSAVANVADTALAGIPESRRPSFVTGLGEGARAEQAAQATQQAIKFKSFDDQLRAAQIHAQDAHLQAITQNEKDAHEDHMNNLHANDPDWGIQYDTIANNSDAVTDYLKTHTAANGSVSVPPGTHISPDGDSILIPKDTPETANGQLKQYRDLKDALGINLAVPNGATKLPDSIATVFYNKLQGFGPDGMPYTADKLPALIASNQSRRADLAKQNAPQVQLDALDGIIAKQQAQLKADNDAMDQASQRKTDSTNQVNDEKAAQARLTNAQKPQKADTNFYEGTDAKGNQVAGTSDELKAAGVNNFAKMPALTQTQTLAARELTSPDGLFATARNQIIALQQSGKLGPVASRWGNFWASKGLDGDQQAFRGTLGLIATKLMQAHMGNRGGKDAMEHFAGLVPENSTPSALMSELNNEYQYVTALAKRPKVVSNGQ